MDGESVGSVGFRSLLCAMSLELDKNKRVRQVEAIENHERCLSRDLRASRSFKASHEMISRQEMEIETAFGEVNYLRAEIALIYADPKINIFCKRLVQKYACASLRELQARNTYNALVHASALNDLKMNVPGAYENWTHRVDNDYNVMFAVKELRDNKAYKAQCHLKKKHEWDYKRAYSIFKSDYKALVNTWPESDYVPTRYKDEPATKLLSNISDKSVLITSDNSEAYASLSGLVMDEFNEGTVSSHSGGALRASVAVTEDYNYDEEEEDCSDGDEEGVDLTALLAASEVSVCITEESEEQFVERLTELVSSQSSYMHTFNDDSLQFKLSGDLNPQLA